ncbi:acireductone synthase, partial [Pseudomonas aeruginosa]
MTIKAILTDIEGTTSAVSFVFDVLFPYAARHLPDFVRE